MVRGAIAIAVGVAAALSLAACGNAYSRTPCAPQPQGAVCIKVFHDGATVRDVIGYLAASSSPRPQEKWRLVLMVYPCDPGGKPVPACIPTHIYPGPTRRGNPAIVQETGSYGDFAGFDLPRKFTSAVWLCVEKKLVQGPPLPPPPRACAAVG